MSSGLHFSTRRCFPVVIAVICMLAGGALAQQETTADSEGKSSPPNTDKTEKSADDAVPSEAQQRELGANEDPLATKQAQREAERTDEKPITQERTTGFDIYASARVRYRERSGDNAWQDGGSRAGALIDWQFKQGSYLFASYEAGFSVLSGVGDFLPGENPDEEFEDSIFTRLRHIGFDAPGFTALIGKNWSTYYQVASFTDRFMGAGGSASGAFNAQTDGGPTGPGRADKAVQAKLSTDFLPHTLFKPFDLNIQVQQGNTIPFGGGAEYEQSFGVSAVVTTQKDFTVGLAYNHANIDLDKNPSLRSVGISGDARAALIGTRGFGDRWYAGLVVARLESHETTDEGIYFDGWGSELYGQYQLFDRVWFIGGYNILEPDADQTQAGDYRIRYAVAGLRYTFDDFRRMIFANIRFDDSVNANGMAGGNVYTIGIRWDLSQRGWHISD